jgi:hypothetical protein
MDGGDDGCTLHVRGVGGELEDEEALLQTFRRFGDTTQATVRHRIDASSGENTSWALVTMNSREGADAALLAAGGVDAGDEELRSPEGRKLKVTRFSQKQAEQSRGAMGSVQK